MAAAARHLEQALALDPANLDLHRRAPSCSRDVWVDCDRPSTLAEYVVARDPVNATVHEQLALSYLYAGRLDEAIAAIVPVSS